MANPGEGELAFTANGKTWVLCFNNRAMCSIEQALNRPVGKLIKEMQDEQMVSINDLVRVFHAGLAKHHANVSLEDACDLVLPGQLTTILGKAFSLAFTSGDERKESQDPPPTPSQ